MHHSNSNWASTPARYLLLSLYWLPISLFWGMMLGQILPIRVEDFAGAAHKGAYLSVIAVSGALASAVIQLVVGPISDHCRLRLGKRRPFLLVGTLAGCAGIVAFGWSRSFLELTVSFFAVQLFLNVANGPYQAFIPDHVARRNQGKASAFMGLMTLLGEAGGPTIAGIAISSAINTATRRYAGLPTAQIEHIAALARLGMFHHLLLIDAALLLICGLVTLLLVPDSPSQNDTSNSSALQDIVQWNIRANPDFLWLLISCIVYNIGFYMALDYLLFYVQDSLGYGALHYSGPMTYLQLITISGALAATFPAGYFADRSSKKRVVYIACAFSAAAGIAFALARSLPEAYVMAAAFGIGFGAFRAVDWSFACNLLPRGGGAAKHMAIWSLAATVPQIIAPSFGRVADTINAHYGKGVGWRVAMIVSAICMVAAAFIMRRVRERPTLGFDLTDTPALSDYETLTPAPNPA